MTKASMFLFMGDNQYALTRELRRWKDVFAEKHGQENLTEVHAKDLTFSHLLDLVTMPPFIAEKRLVVVHGIPAVEKDEMRSLAESVHPQALLAFVDPKPDKRFASFRELQKVADIKSFPSLPRPALIAWARQIALSNGCSIDDLTLSSLFDVVGVDQWTLDAELSKLCLYVGSGPVTSNHIDLLSVPSGDHVIWTLTDLLGAGRVLDAIMFLHRRIERGEDPYGVWAILLNATKNLLLVAAAIEAGQHDERSIASSTGLHAFAARGLLPLAKKLTINRIAALVEFATSKDIALKTGGFRYTAEQPHEVIVLSERLMLMCLSS